MKEIEDFEVEQEYDCLYRNKLESIVLKHGTEDQYPKIIQLQKQRKESLLKELNEDKVVDRNQNKNIAQQPVKKTAENQFTRMLESIDDEALKLQYHKMLAANTP